MGFKLTDFLFLIGIVLIFLPIFRFDVDVGLFVLGVCTVLTTWKINKVGGNDK